jgi:hypothetical protein
VGVSGLRGRGPGRPVPPAYRDSSSGSADRKCSDEPKRPGPLRRAIEVARVVAVAAPLAGEASRVLLAARGASQAGPGHAVPAGPLETAAQDRDGPRDLVTIGNRGGRVAELCPGGMTVAARPWEWLCRRGLRLRFLWLEAVSGADNSRDSWPGYLGWLRRPHSRSTYGCGRTGSLPGGARCRPQPIENSTIPCSHIY